MGMSGKREGGRKKEAAVACHGEQADSRLFFKARLVVWRSPVGLANVAVLTAFLGDRLEVVSFVRQ